MQSSDVPARFTLPFASSAGPGFIRTIPSPSQTGGAASLTDGFPAVTMQPIATGGIPPFGQDMNGILKQVTQWNQWHGAGGPIIYDATFATAIGGYPKSSVLVATSLDGKCWLNLINNNTSNPDLGGANWLAFNPTTPPVMATPAQMEAATASSLLFASPQNCFYANSALKAYAAFNWNGSIIQGITKSDYSASSTIFTRNAVGSFNLQVTTPLIFAAGFAMAFSDSVLGGGVPSFIHGQGAAFSGTNPNFNFYFYNSAGALCDPVNAWVFLFGTTTNP